MILSGSNFTVKVKLVPVLILMILLPVTNADAAGISLENRVVTVEEAIDEIKKQTNYIFAINHKNLNHNRKVTLTGRKLSVENVLKQILAGTEHEYTVTESHILIYPKRPRPAQQPVSNNDEGLEDDITAYNARHPERQVPPKPDVKYDTIVRLVPQDPNGEYFYPSVSKILYSTGEQVTADVYLKKPASLSVKTNLLYGATTLALNAGVEIGVGKRTSVDLFFSQNPWNLKGSAENNKKLVHWILKPEFRYWMCERSNGHFVGAHAFYWRYNIGGYDVPLLFDKDYRNDGNAWGAGVSYGYHWPWSKRWGMEFNIGGGVAFMKYSKFSCPKCGEKEGDYKKTYFGPTSVGVKLVFVIK